MASGNRKRFACGHRGFGKFCHRCSFADKLQELLDKEKFYIDHKTNKVPHKWTKEEMFEEIKRLKNTDRH